MGILKKSRTKGSWTPETNSAKRSPTLQRMKMHAAHGVKQKKAVDAEKIQHLPPLLPRESLVQQHKDLRYVEQYVFQVQLFLVVFLHLEQVVKLEIELQ